MLAVVLTIVLTSIRANKVNAAFLPLYQQRNFSDAELMNYEFYPDETQSFFEIINAEVLRWNQASAKQQWATATGEERDRSGRLELMEAWTKWHNHVCQVKVKTSDNDPVDDIYGVFRHVSNNEQVRMAYILCRGPRYSSTEAREVLELSENMGRLYAETEVCRGPEFPRCYNIEPELDLLMRTSTDPAELLWSWVEWRNKIGPKARVLYPQLIDLMNIGARNNGFDDIGAAWRDELEAGDLEKLVDELYEEIRPLFRKLHAFVMAKLSSVYDFDATSGLIPAHLLGNMWAQEWSSLLPLLHNSSARLDLDGGLLAKNYTVWDLVRRAEDFYVSLGLARMPPKFWINSQIIKREDRVSNCHGTAANIYTGDDFRLLMCARVTWEDFHVIHHEMGHIQYFMAYSNQPPVFQAGANSAFHEAVGETVMLGVQSPLHLVRLGVLPGDEDVLQKDIEIALLLKTALNKVPQIVFGLMMDKWRWMVMRGDVTPRQYNTVWWELHREFLGVRPPVLRSPIDFDPASKFHIMDNTPYIRYFLSGFLQMQFFESMCIATIPNQTKLPFPLHRCDIYGNKEAGQLLKKMMSLGCSVHPQEALATITRGRYHSYSAKPLLMYFHPLSQWLDRQLDKASTETI